MILLLTYYLILILYAVIVLVIPGIGLIGILKGKKRKEAGNLKVSILIPFRNESESLKELCQSINKLDYPKDWYEVIFIDDNSSDQSLTRFDSLDQDIHFNVIQNDEHLGKKASLLKGLEESRFDYIITTDADCKLPRNLLRQLQPEDDISVGVALKTASNWKIIQNVQEVESLMLAGITLGSVQMEIPMLSSGANLAYRKSFFKESSPYADNMDINSGDDMFLLKAGLDHECSIAVRAAEPVLTKCESYWEDYINQSARWAGKNNNVGLPQATLASWLVLIANIVLPISLVTHFSSGWIILFIKFVVDFLFLFLTATYYERFKALLFAPVVFWFYPIHLIRVLIRIVSNRGKKL